MRPAGYPDALLAAPPFLFAAGALLVVPATLFLLVPEFSTEARILFGFYVLFGAMNSATHFRELQKIHFKHDLRVCLIANSRTLAILRFGAPPRYLKRRDCVSLEREPFVLVFADGTRHEIRCDGVGRMKTLTDLIYPLYGMWSRAAPLKTSAPARSIDPVESPRRFARSD